MNKLKLNHIYCGNVLTELKKIPKESIDCIITSPPYFGLRDYGKETRIIWDGDENCVHDFSLKTTKMVGNNSMP